MLFSLFYYANSISGIRQYLFPFPTVSGIRVVLILSCKGKAYGRTPSIALLTCFRFFRQASANPGFGYSAKILTVYLSCRSVCRFWACM